MFDLMPNVFHRRGKLKLNSPQGSTLSYRNQIIGATGCALVSVTMSFLFGFTATTLPGMMNPGPEDTLSLSEEEAAIVVSVISVGGLCGSLASSPLLFLFGQRKLMMLYLPCQLLWWILMSKAKVFWLVATCRFLQGIGNGFFAGATSTYLAEVCHPNIRGRMFGLIGLFRQIGFLIVYLVGSVFRNWRNVALFCGILGPILPFCVFLFMPDSPRWLAAKKRFDCAENSLSFFRGSNYDIQIEFNSIVKQLSTTTKKTTMVDQVKMLKNKSLAIIFSILLTCSFLVHFTGSIAVQSYSLIIFAAATDKVDAYMSTVIVGASRIAGGMIFILLSERCRRRMMFLVPHALSLLSIGSLGVYFYYKDELTAYSWTKWMPIVCVLCLNVFFTAAMSAFGCIRSELLPTEFRSFGTGLLFTLNYAGTFSVTMSFFSLKSMFGLAGAFWTYSIVGSIVLILVLIFIPETKGKTLEDISQLK